MSAAGAAVPANRSATLQQGLVVGSSPVALDIDVAATPIAGNGTLNGAAVAGSRAASLILYGPNGDLAVIGALSPSSRAYSALVVPGAYHLHDAVYSPDPALPANSNAGLGCFTVGVPVSFGGPPSDNSPP